MTRTTRVAAALVAGALCGPAAARAQLPSMDQIAKGAKILSDLTITADEEREIGEHVSERVRQRYGVVQDRAVHRYVSLVGALLTQAGPRPGLAWRFIVLDTDGVNAFAAPGGFIHVTRGALALAGSEAELAGVLAHEVSHVTQQHTIKAIKKSKVADLGIQAGAERAPGGGLSEAAIAKLADRATELVLAGFGRAEELEADALGVALADRVGYAPGGLAAFLSRLEARNKDASGKQGLFASHPEMQERLARLDKQVASQKLASAATLEDRYRKAITYQPRPQAEIPQAESGAAGLAGGTAPDGAAPAGSQAKPAEPAKKRSFGLGSLMKPSGEEKKSAQVTGSGGSRGVDAERNAKGGANPAAVVVTLTAADVERFRKEGALK